MGGHLHLNYLKTLLWSPYSKFKLGVISNKQLLRKQLFESMWSGVVQSENNTTPPDHPIGWVFPLGPRVAISQFKIY